MLTHDRTAARALSVLLQRERELDLYRQAVERYLGSWLELRAEDHEQFFEYVERCYDWGVNAPACARTWVAKVEASQPAGR